MSYIIELRPYLGIIFTSLFITTMGACGALGNGVPLESALKDRGYASTARLVTTSWVEETIDNDNIKIIDIRKPEDYEAGHIPGALHLDWLKLMDPDNSLSLVKNIDELLHSNGITKEKDIIAHCQTHHRSGLAYMAARLLGYKRIRAYHGSWSEWGNRSDTPVEL